MRKQFCLILVLAAIPFAGCNGPVVDKGKSDNYYYDFSSREKIVYSHRGNLFELGKTEIKDADSKSFVVLNAYYAKDKSRAYFKANPIPDADPSSFVGLEDNLYAKDNQRVYLKGEPISTADSSTFQVASSLQNYSKDARSVYLNSQKIETADPATFEVIDQYEQYGKDAKTVYHRLQPIEADPASFAILGQRITKDKDHVYFDDKIMADADAPTFEKIKGVWYRDKSSVFYLNLRLKEADRNNFRVLEEDGRYGRDNQHVYYFDVINDEWVYRTITPDFESFQILNKCGYAKDINHVYFGLVVIPEADPATFRIRDACMYGDDAQHTFFKGKIVKPT